MSIDESIGLEDQQAIFLSCVKKNMKEAIGSGYYPNLRSIVRKRAAAKNVIFNSTPNTSYRYRTQSSAAKGKEVDSSINSI